VITGVVVEAVLITSGFRRASAIYKDTTCILFKRANYSQTLDQGSKFVKIVFVAGSLSWISLASLQRSPDHSAKFQGKVCYEKGGRKRVGEKGMENDGKSIEPFLIIGSAAVDQPQKATNE